MVIGSIDLDSHDVQIVHEEVLYTPLPNGEVREETIGSEVYATGLFDDMTNLYLDLPKKLREKFHLDDEFLFNRGDNFIAHFDGNHVHVYMFVDDNTRAQLRQYITEQYGGLDNYKAHMGPRVWKADSSGN